MSIAMPGSEHVAADGTVLLARLSGASGAWRGANAATVDASGNLYFVGADMAPTARSSRPLPVQFRLCRRKHGRRDQRGR